MSPKNALLLTVLAALWGASFLFIRIGVAEFGVAPLMALRVGIGALFLTALALTRFKPADLVARLRRHAWPLFVVGVLNSGAPFCLFAFAELTLSAGVTSVINATTPLWGALVAYLWLKDRLSLPRALGLVIGFAGVLTLVWDQIAHAHGSAGASATALAAAAALGATLLYGIAANYTKRRLGGVDPLINATGSMIGSTVLLLPFALATWPAAPVSAHAWGAVLGLGIACTGIAYFIFFYLISHVGPARAITVTFVIPVFGLLWGALFLGEHVSLAMIEGCAIVLVGTALATGVIRRIPGVGPRGGEAA
ncbi:multidrug DMT transporter permease [Burkholderia pseudomultivorans]|uniref:Multidrug DMT transporter permease n=1 Tax=Burkholderia pseudomultivorans TaxID=1207504 RepID=A0A132F317_9BURK|nr:DMT family transporter [Burkholderia pseudomultivorans]AOI91770.1 multidrug DMT transporter permease [Burkholderia pseudomultivorans]KVC49723.1 multidrug DMT transporter permease [Burkholderia pseudomultivorans]KWF07105.1 multidrug DMT transporter permease [Burkholderia pseudomultivorans]KWF68035.1 multidrug DMT transporter permease [Burkholderia pseudomultivorans]